jgi:hypothetical protein
MKAKLMDLATERRSMQIAIMVAGIGAFYTISLLIDSHREMWFGLYALFIVGWIVFRLLVAIRKYRELGFSEAFVQSQLKAGIIRIIGLAVFFAVLIESAKILTSTYFPPRRTQHNSRGSF